MRGHWCRRFHSLFLRSQLFIVPVHLNLKKEMLQIFLFSRSHISVRNGIDEAGIGTHDT